MKQNETYDRLLEEIESLYEHNDPRTVRRALNVVRRLRDGDPKEKPICPVPNATVYDNDSILEEHIPSGMRNIVAERDFAERSRNVIVDAKLAAFRGMVDLFSGRIEQLDLIGTSLSHDELSELEERAIEFIGISGAAIRVNLLALGGYAKAATALREMADELEENAGSDVETLPPDLHAKLGFQPRPECKCSKVGEESSGKFWEGGNRRLVKNVRDVLTCWYVDDCGPGRSYTSYGKWRKVVLWENGDPNSKPPVADVPAKWSFKEYPWTNKCAVLPAGLNANVTSGWGWRQIRGGISWHKGIDIGVPSGTDVLAVEAGEVLLKSKNTDPNNIGAWVKSATYVRQYWHIRPAPWLKDGDKVKTGDLLGYVTEYYDDNGERADHLHFVRYEPADPKKWWANPGTATLNPCP